MKICVIAGEPSGDFLGAKLIDAIKLSAPEVKFSGVGGPMMIAAGQPSIFAYEELAVMGVAEIAPKLFGLMARIRQTINHIKETKPDIVVTIDSPDFCFRVAKAVKREMKADAPKIVHYVAPTVWAWREGRAAKIAKFLDGLICLFDFEPSYFDFKAVAVGHPMVECEALKADGARFREECGIAQSETIIGVLFGSRKGEIKRTGKILRDAAYVIAEQLGGNVHIVAPTLPHVKHSVTALLKDAPCAIHITDDAAEKYDAFKSMDVALACSGTVGLELAMLQVPHVIAYKLSPITFHLVKNLIKVKYAHLANIMTESEIVPEFIQKNCKADLIADAALQLFKDPAGQKEQFAHIAERLGAGQIQTPSEKAAAFVLSCLSRESGNP